MALIMFREPGFREGFLLCPVTPVAEAGIAFLSPLNFNVRLYSDLAAPCINAAVAFYFMACARREISSLGCTGQLALKQKLSTSTSVSYKIDCSRRLKLYW
jgi:hypothetical protein